MLGNRRLVVDNFAEIHSMLIPWITETFYDFSQVIPQPGSIYVIGRQQLLDNHQRIVEMAESDQYTMIFNNSAEGSWTLESQLIQLKLTELVIKQKILLIGGAPVNPQYPCLTHEHFLSHILDYKENIKAQASTEIIYKNKEKPYKFLFLNGRARPHRKYLYERLKRTGALDQSLYTMLDAKPTIVQAFTFRENGINIMATPSELKRLPDEYEVERYRSPEFGPIVLDRSFLKQELFRREWGEIYVEPRPYIDTYFSLVTETVCAESTISFCTEKIAKPLLIGHPFIVASTPGFYQNLHNLGFKTFGHVIDESFDLIDDAQDRMNRIVSIVTDLCQQDLAKLLEECYTMCKHNQQRLAELQQEVRREFPKRFFQYLKDYNFE